MHPYQIDDDIKTRKILVLVVLSIFFAYILGVFLQKFPSFTLWWVDYPSVFGFYAILVWIYDNYIWKLKWIQKFDWLAVPNLSGTWSGEIKSSYNNFEKAYPCLIHIRQTGSRILILLENDKSQSHSIHAAILKSNKVGESELMYNFVNEPKADSTSTMNIHYGTAWLQILSANTLDGEYFTGRGRQTYGKIALDKKFLKSN